MLARCVCGCMMHPSYSCGCGCTLAELDDGTDVSPTLKGRCYGQTVFDYHGKYKGRYEGYTAPGGDYF